MKKKIQKKKIQPAHFEKWLKKEFLNSQEEESVTIKKISKGIIKDFTNKQCFSEWFPYYEIGRADAFRFVMSAWQHFNGDV